MKRISAIFIVMVIAGMNSAVAQKERNHGQTPPGPSGKPSMWRGTGMQKFHEITDAKHRFQVESPGLGWRRQADSSFPLALFRDGTSVQAFFVVAKPSVDIETIFNRLTGKLRLAVEKPLEMIPLPARQDVHCASGAARIEVSRKEKFVVDRQFAIYELAGPDYKVAMLIIGTGADIAAVQAEIDLLSTSLKILDKSAPPGPNPHKHP